MLAPAIDAFLDIYSSNTCQGFQFPSNISLQSNLYGCHSGSNIGVATREKYRESLRERERNREFSRERERQREGDRERETQSQRDREPEK